MSFIRIKKIKGKEYGYLVNNVWLNKNTRQRVLSYLGRVYRFRVKRNMGFSRFVGKNFDMYVERYNFRRIIHDLVKWELYKNVVKGFLIDLEEGIVRKDGRKAVLAINHGFLCDYTLKNLLSLKLGGKDKGYELAKLFVDAGIAIPKTLFIKLYERLDNNNFKSF